MNRVLSSLHGGSLEITHTVPLTMENKIRTCERTNLQTVPGNGSECVIPEINRDQVPESSEASGAKIRNVILSEVELFNRILNVKFNQ